jgi:hypothetical protein
MIHLTSNRKKIPITKPENFENLISKVCSLYGVSKDRLLLALVEENQDKLVLERDSEYARVFNSPEDAIIKVLIRPRVYSKRLIQAIGCIGLVLYTTIQYFIGLPIGILDGFRFSIALVYELYEMVVFLGSNITGVLYWIPFVLPLVYLSYLGYYWLSNSKPLYSLSKFKIFYWGFFASNLIPNIIGFITSMLTIMWVMLVYSNVALHRPRPLTTKDYNFLIVLLAYLVTSIARIIYFY